MRETNHHNKLLSLASALRQGVSVLDGSMGVMLQRLGRSGNFDALCLSEPELIADIHRRYLEAGADIIETNTFNSNRLSQRAYGMEGLVGELNRAGARIARREADRVTAIDPTRPRFVAGSMGPTGVSASISADVEDSAARSVTFAELAEAYAEQAYALIEGDSRGQQPPWLRGALHPLHDRLRGVRAPALGPYAAGRAGRRGRVQSACLRLQLLGRTRLAGSLRRRAGRDFTVPGDFLPKRRIAR